MTNPRPSEVQALETVREMVVAGKALDVLAELWPDALQRPLYTIRDMERARGARVAPSPTEHVHEYDYRDSRCVVSGLYPPSCQECMACEVIDHCACGFERRSGVAPSPDAPGLREAIEEIRWTGTDCPAAMQPESFYRQQLHRVIGIATRAALAASGDAPREGLDVERLARVLAARDNRRDDVRRAVGVNERDPSTPAEFMRTAEAIAREYASESHPTKEQLR